MPLDYVKLHLERFCHRGVNHLKSNLIGCKFS